MYASLQGRILLGEGLLGEVGEPEVGSVGAAVVVELGARVDVGLLADVELCLGIGDRVVRPRELRIAGEVDAERDDELVLDDPFLEVGTWLADGQEVVELGVCCLIWHSGPLPSRLG